MRLVLGLAGALCALAFAILYLGNTVGNIAMSRSVVESPDQAGSIHAAAYILTLIACTIGGYITGALIGGLFSPDRADAFEETDEI